MLCPNCHSRIPEEAKFCPKCGVSLLDGNRARKQPIKPISISPHINVSPEIKVEDGGKVEFSPTISLSPKVELASVNDEEIVQRIKQLENELERLTKTKLNFKQLEQRYSREDLVKILEAFRILLKIREMAERDSHVWEYEEQLNLLERCLDFNQNLVRDLEEEIRKIIAATRPDEKISRELAWRVKRIVNDVIDVWISEFLNSKIIG